MKIIPTIPTLNPFLRGLAENGNTNTAINPMSFDVYDNSGLIYTLEGALGFMINQSINDTSGLDYTIEGYKR